MIGYSDIFFGLPVQKYIENMQNIVTVNFFSKFFSQFSIEMHKFLLSVQPNLHVIEKTDEKIRIQRPKTIENDHTHQMCI